VARGAAGIGKSLELENAARGDGSSGGVVRSFVDVDGAPSAGCLGTAAPSAVDQEYFLSATLRERPAARLRFIILRPCLVRMRARKPMERFLLMRLTRCG
jgi:hypothetical protein